MGECDKAPVRDWTPTPPAGEGWLLVAKYGTKNDAVALFVRPFAAPGCPFDLWPNGFDGRGLETRQFEASEVALLDESPDCAHFSVPLHLPAGQLLVHDHGLEG
jgi:hypothetical protein